MRQAVDLWDENTSLSHEPSPALLVVGHGSRDPRGAREFHELVELVRRTNPSLMIEGGFIELSRPPISECVDRLAEEGVRHVAAVPLMLLSAGHAKDDIPATLVREKMNHPGMNFRYGRALGIRPELLDLMDERVSAVVTEREKEDTAVLIVGRGSSDPRGALSRSELSLRSRGSVHAPQEHVQIVGLGCERLDHDTGFLGERARCEIGGELATRRVAEQA